MLGKREVDFDAEGLIHLGLAVELLEDVRGGGVADEGLEALFKSA